MTLASNIASGDIVEVVLIYHQNANPDSFKGVVLYVPSATGDCWHIREWKEDGRLRYVQNFAEIILVEKIGL